MRASVAWVNVSQRSATVSQETRITVDIDWTAALRRMQEHVETGGVVAIEATHYAKAFAPAGRSWLTIPDHGCTLSGVTMLPVDAPALDLKQNMRLDYPMVLATSDKVQVQVMLAPTQKFHPGAGLRFAVAVDGAAPQIVNVHADTSYRLCEKTVSDGAVTFTTTHHIAAPGQHTRTYWPLDAGLVRQKLVIDASGLKPSYLGPPENPRIGATVH